MKREFKRDSVTIKKWSLMLPAFEMILDNKLAFTIKVCEWLLPEDHEL